MKNPKLVCGGGINDKTRPTYINGKITKEYNLWQGMLNRCYCPKTHAKYQAYIGCGVSDNFKSYSYFYDWCQNQIGFGVDGWDLDKDIFGRNNKVYSEDKCVFVPKDINKFFVNSVAKRGEWPLGVYFHKNTGKYMAVCSVNGKAKNLGYFNTPEQAHAVYKQFKEALCKETAAKWYGKIDQRVYYALMVWSI